MALGKPPRRAVTIWCDWRSSRHYHYAWRSWLDLGNGPFALYALQQFLISISHTEKLYPVFIPKA